MVDPEDISVTELYRLVGAGVWAQLAPGLVVSMALAVLNFARTGCSRCNPERGRRVSAEVTVP